MGMIVDVHVLRLVERRAHRVIPVGGVCWIPVHDCGACCDEERIAFLLELCVLEPLAFAGFFGIDPTAPPRGRDSPSGYLASSFHWGGGRIARTTTDVLPRRASE